MPEDPYQSKMPGVYIEEIPSGSNPILGVGTSTAAFIGRTANDQLKDKPTLITSWNEFEKNYRSKDITNNTPFSKDCALPYAVNGFFNEGGTKCYVTSINLSYKPYVFTAPANSFVVSLKDNKSVININISDIQGNDFNLVVTPDAGTPQTLALDFSALTTTFEAKDKNGTDSTYVEFKKSSDGARIPDPLDNPQTLNKETTSYTFTSSNPVFLVRRQDGKTEDLEVNVDNVSGTNFDLTVSSSATDIAAQTLPIDFQTLSSTDYTNTDKDNNKSSYVEFRKANDSATVPAKLNNPAPLPTTFEPPSDEPVWLDNLRKLNDINIISFPDISEDADDVVQQYITLGYKYCYERQYCFFIIDPPKDKTTVNSIKGFANGIGDYIVNIDGKDNSVKGRTLNKYSAIYFPGIKIPNPVYNKYSDNPLFFEKTIEVPPSGAVAGVYARTDANRGVWKAPAGINDGRIYSSTDVMDDYTEKDYGTLNCYYINSIRKIKDTGVCIWGARTVAFIPPDTDCAGFNTEWRYINVRRLFNFVEESLYRGTQWVVFEPNSPELWGLVKRNITAFLTEQWKQGAFFGAKPEEAFFVQIDKNNNPPETREIGELIIDVGIAPVFPAEFVIIRIMQKTLTE